MEGGSLRSNQLFMKSGSNLGVYGTKIRPEICHSRYTSATLNSRRYYPAVKGKVK
jgi:hypothetical protein